MQNFFDKPTWGSFFGFALENPNGRFLSHDGKVQSENVTLGIAPVIHLENLVKFEGFLFIAKAWPMQSKNCGITKISLGNALSPEELTQVINSFKA